MERGDEAETMGMDRSEELEKVLGFYVQNTARKQIVILGCVYIRKKRKLRFLIQQNCYFFNFGLYLL